jgi:hypothetical protein
MKWTVNTTRAKLELQGRVKRVARAMANELKEAIKDNSKNSKTITGGKMRKYSPAYLKWRQKHGLSSTPDLRVRGHLLDDAAILGTTAGATLKPNSPDRLKAEGNQRYRKFYPEQESDIKGPLLKRLKSAGEKALVS